MLEIFLYIFSFIMVFPFSLHPFLETREETLSQSIDVVLLESLFIDVPVTSGA